MATIEEIEDIKGIFSILAEPIPVQEKGKNEEEKMNEKYGTAAKIKTTVESICYYAKKGIIGITFLSLPFFGTYAANYLAQSNTFRTEFIKAEEKIAEKNQQIEQSKKELSQVLQYCSLEQAENKLLYLKLKDVTAENKQLAKKLEEIKAAITSGLEGKFLSPEEKAQMVAKAIEEAVRLHKEIWQKKEEKKNKK